MAAGDRMRASPKSAILAVPVLSMNCRVGRGPRVGQEGVVWTRPRRNGGNSGSRDAGSKPEWRVTNFGYQLTTLLGLRSRCNTWGTCSSSACKWQTRSAGTSDGGQRWQLGSAPPAHLTCGHERC